MSQPLIIGAITIAVVDTTVADLRSTTGNVPAFRIIIGGFVVVVALLAVSDYNEELADSFAILVLLATVFGPKAGGISAFLSKVLGTDNITLGQQVAAAAHKGAVATVNTSPNVIQS